MPLQLRTARLLLRDAQTKDAIYLSAYHGDERYLQFYAAAPDSELVVRQAIEWAKENPRQNFQLIVERNDTVVGCAGLRLRGYPQGEAEIGVEVNPDYWRQGFAKEIVVALIELAEQRDLKLIWAVTHQDNYRAIDLMISEKFVLDRHENGEAIMVRRLAV